MRSGGESGESKSSIFDAEMPVLIITPPHDGQAEGGVALASYADMEFDQQNLNWDSVSTDITTVHAPLFNNGGFNVLTLPLLHVGATVIILRTFDAARVLELIEKYRCTFFFGVPTMYQMMLEEPSFATTDFSSLRYFISGGAPCPVPLIEE